MKTWVHGDTRSQQNCQDEAPGRGCGWPRCGGCPVSVPRCPTCSLWTPHSLCTLVVVLSVCPTVVSCTQLGSDGAGCPAQGADLSPTKPRTLDLVSLAREGLRGLSHTWAVHGSSPCRAAPWGFTFADCAGSTGAGLGGWVPSSALPAELRLPQSLGGRGESGRGQGGGLPEPP